MNEILTKCERNCWKNNAKTLSNNFEFERLMNVEKAAEAVGEVAQPPAQSIPAGKESVFVSGIDPTITEAALKGFHL